MASLLALVKIALIIGVVMMEKLVQSLNINVNNYPLVAWCQENKISACLIIYFLFNTIEQQLMATGAFEISMDGQHLWSKLESGRLPSLPELFSMLEDKPSTSSNSILHAAPQ